MGPRHLSFSGRVSQKPMPLYDRWLLVAALSLTAMGLLMVASTSIVISEKSFHQPFHFLTRQAVFLGVGCMLGLLVMRIEVARWQQMSMVLLISSVVLLITVLIPGIGHEVNGSMRWIGIGGFGLQVSEFAKLGVIVYLASYITRHQQAVQTQVSGFVKPMLVLAVVGALLLKEPDFGAVVVLLCTALGMMYLAGVRLWQFAVLLLVALAAVAVLAISSPYRLARLTSFLNPWANQFDSGYQLTQSLIAFGRGSWMGLGLGESVQKLFYLPEAHTDFMLAVLAEELGLLGVLAVSGLFVLLVARALIIARRAQLKDLRFAAFIAYGLGLQLALQVMINIGVNTGLLPTKGLTLPLMSYGGSSMLMTCVSVALLLRIDHETRWQVLGL